MLNVGRDDYHSSIIGLLLRKNHMVAICNGNEHNGANMPFDRTFNL